MKYCYYCGAQMADDAAFCGNCGNKVREDASAAQSSFEQQPQQPNYEQQPYQPPVYEQPPVYSQQPSYQPPMGQSPSVAQPSLVMCIITLALGATSLMLCWYGLVGLPFAIVGFIFGNKQLEIGYNKMAHIGRLLSLIGIIVNAVSALTWIIVYIVGAF